jgi:hypothetical protein
MASKHFLRGAVCIPVAAILLSLCVATRAAGRTDDANSRTVVVALDRDAYQARDMILLEDQVTEAARSQFDRISMSGSQDENTITVTIHDLARDTLFQHAVEKEFGDGRDFALSEESATTLRVSYPQSMLKTYDPEVQVRDIDTLMENVGSLRPPLPGVTMEEQSDGTIVRSDDPFTGDIIKRVLGAGFVVTPISKTAWHVAWNTNLLPNALLTKRPEFVEKANHLVRQFLRDPLDAELRRTAEGVEVTVPDSELRSEFVQNVRRNFAQNPKFTLVELPSLILHITLPEPGSQAIAEAAPTPISKASKIDKPFWEAIAATEALAKPSVEITVVGNSVIFGTQDPSQNAYGAAIVRQALSARTDLVIDTQPDQSLRIGFAPAADPTSKLPDLQPGQLVDAVQARAAALKLQPSSVVPLDSEHVRAAFFSVAAAGAFRDALSKFTGISIRLVDDAQSSSATAPPSQGDERLSGQDSEKFWVRPEAIITSDMVADARASENKYIRAPEIEIRLTDEGRIRFAAATRQYVGRRFAIVLDGKVISAPMVQSAISGGAAEITGNFTPESADALAQSISHHGDGLQLKIVGPEH